MCIRDRWIHYILTRTHSSTQKEHRLIAEEALSFFKAEFPEIYSVVFETPNTEADSLISLQAALVEEKVK
jgi:thymidylate synthase ThyX